MIRKLRVENYAIVRDLEVEFDNGLTILSGETGAGKSIIVGALGLILGERASSETVRSGEDVAVVEAEIDDLPKRTLDSLRDIGVAIEGQTVIFRREVQNRGSSRAFINNQVVTLGNLKAIASEMVDLIGQHQQQYLINVDHHLGFLDNFGGLSSLCDDVGTLYNRSVALDAELEQLEANALRNKEMAELHKFQIQEIEQAGLSCEEEESLGSEKRVLENAEKLKSTLGFASSDVFLAENSITSRIAQVESMLRDLAKIDESISESLESASGARYELEELGRTLASRAEAIEADQNRLKEIEGRLDIYYNLKKKYGGSIDALSEYHEKIKRAVDSDADLDSRIEEIRGELETTRTKLTEAAIMLSDRRQKNAGTLSKKVEKEIAQLGIAKAQFEVRVTRRKSDNGLIESEGARYDVYSNGIDDVEFYFCANRGEELRPLAKIASGGELSRVMLALKSVGANRKKLETLIFDEVDSGIGGEVAAAVGRKLRDLAKKHQIVVITHLQQIAAAGDHHYRVYKEKSSGRMVTRISKLTDKERREEIGRMLSGEKLTETSLTQAEELLEQFE